MNLTFNVKQSIETVFDYLTDMDKFASVHPVISKIDHLSENNYLVHETLRLGLIPFSFTYPVTLEKNVTDKKIILKAIVMKVTKIEMTYTLSTNEEGTTVNEIITFKSILPIKVIMKNIFRTQHTLLFAKIGNLK